MKKLPAARTADIVVQTLGKEILIYDLNTHKAFNLNETSSIVYQSCDGRTTFAELSARNNFTDDIIFLAIDELDKENLIEKSEEYNSPFKGLSRREAIRKVGFASIIALPVIASLVAPTSAMAQSGGAAASCAATGETCDTADGTQSNCCSSTDRCYGAGCSACTPAGDTVGPGGCFGVGCCDSQLGGFEATCCSGSFNEVDNIIGFNRKDCVCTA